MPSGFRAVAAHDLGEEWRQPLRRLERGIRLLPKLHPEVVTADPRVFIDRARGDVLLLAAVRMAEGMTPAARQTFLRRALSEVFGPDRPPEIVYTRSRGGKTRQYAESAGGETVLTKLGCLVASGEGDRAWFIAGLWRLGGKDPFRMDHHLSTLADQLDGS